jgi:uncharacterized protein (DUF433 family)
MIVRINYNPQPLELNNSRHESIVSRFLSAWVLPADCAHLDGREHQYRRECASSARLRDNEIVTRAITRDPETMHGVPVFRGTRVPVQTLFEYLEGGDTLEDFLEGFPTVSRTLALEALEEAKQLLLSRV